MPNPRHGRQHDTDAERAVAEGERRYALDLLADEARRCPDCGEYGERAGHMGCQYPQDRD